MSMKLIAALLTKRRIAAAEHARLETAAEKATVYIARDGCGNVIGTR